MPRPNVLGLERLSLTVCLVVGAILTVIGIRYILVPASAAYTFGVVDRSTGFELHYIIAGRNIWLGLLAMGLAAMREWRGLALWFGIGSIVCFFDAAIALTSSGRPVQVVFHIGSGIIFCALTVLFLRKERKMRTAFAQQSEV
jgi:hypothetical protein